MFEHVASPKFEASALKRMLIWLPFVALLAWSWRFYDLVNTLPAYGDALESLWAIDWYRQSLFVQHSIPLFNPDVFYPGGWHSATWANGMLIYWVGAGMAQLTGSAALAFNVLVLAPYVVSYAGCVALLKRHGSLLAAVIGSLIFTFWQFHWLRAAGHVQVAWCIGLLPWFVFSLESIQRGYYNPRNQHTPSSWQWASVWAGLLWGLMIQSTLYGIFWGGIVLALFAGRWAMQRRGRFEAARSVGLVVGVAGLLAAPLVILYVLGTRADQTISPGLLHARAWSASLNSLFAANAFSPLPWVQSFSRLVYSGRIDEASAANAGVTLWGVTFASALMAWRKRKAAGYGLYVVYAVLVVACILLSLGPVLDWNGGAVQSNRFSILNTLNTALWRAAHWLRPGQFPVPDPVPPFASGIPLPGYVFYALVPFADSARVLSRYMLVCMLGCAVFMTLGLSRLKPWAQLLIGCVCLIEVLPYPIFGVPVPVIAHPAYRWVSSQPQAQQTANAVLEILDTKLIPVNGEAIFATTFYGRPTLNGLGSFPPKHLAALQNWMNSQPDSFASPAFAAALSHYGVRYVVLHLTQKNSTAWSEMQRNPLLLTENCFAPARNEPAWPLTLCVAQIKTPALQARNLMLQSGWGAPEDWGVWATTLESQAQFMAARQQDRQLEVSAFPVCIKNQPQKIVIKINDTFVGSYTWKACEVWNTTLQVPGDLLRVGLNQITFSSAVAASPHDADATNNDRRVLAIGFTTLRVVTSGP